MSNEYYNNLLDNLQVLYGMEQAESVFRTLTIITELMIHVYDGILTGAEYKNEFKQDRMLLKVFVEKK